MPLVSSDYNPSFLFKKGHVSTIYSGLIRRVEGVIQQRERLELADGDFMDLDWSFTTGTSHQLVLLLHGLEGNGQRPYITGCAREFNRNGYDACAVNFRGCSGETNRLYRSYHSGATEDLDAVILHILNTKKYQRIYINGFSLGGNMALKYVGENRDLPKEIKGVVGISVPCGLHSSLVELLKPKNFLYARRFKKHLVAKLKAKQKLHPGLIKDSDIRNIKNLKDFDDIYTSRAHGFADALDYYNQCSCLPFLRGISVPSLLLNAKNDSFLGPECYPFREAENSPFLYLETPYFGGHVGFYLPDNRYYNEKRAINFLEEVG
jgi:predicted alpha/beta-fold hydrolase